MGIAAAIPAAGLVAEWLCSGLQIRQCRFDSGPGLHRGRRGSPRGPMRELDQRLMSRAATAVRRAMPSHRWAEFADAIAADRTLGEGILRKPPSEINRTMFANLDSFRRDGVATVPFGLGPKNIAAIR